MVIDLNDSGEMHSTRIVHGAALHIGRGERTSPHEQYVWKLHVGLDAPVWFESDSLHLTPTERARAVIVPPGVRHRVGAVGWACTLLIAPGTRGTAWRGAEPWVVDGKQAQRLVDASSASLLCERTWVSDFATQVVALGLPETRASSPVDTRVRKALQILAREPGCSLGKLAQQLGISLDRLSHLTVEQTATPLRKHALWSRLLALLSANRRYSSVAAAAIDAGFSDHAHMTRTYRAMLGRLPSEFSGPPDAIESYSSWR